LTGDPKVKAMRQSCPVTTIKMLAKPADVSAANYKAVGNANQWFWFCNADAA